MTQSIKVFSLGNKIPTCNKNKIEYINLPFCFDTETTSYINKNNEKVGFIYIWQLCGIEPDDDHCITGRTIEEFVELCNQLVQLYNLNKNRRLVIYVHNLPFDFQFIKKYFDFEKVFCTNMRKVLFAVTKNGIEFRDSYIYSRLSLEKIGENLIYHNIEKMVGDLDYSKIRSPLTKLSEKEMGYCLNDVKVLCAYIKEQLLIYKTVAKMPYTNTGKVRSYVKHHCLKSKTFKTIMKRLTLDLETYLRLHKAFTGGFTHANYRKVGKIIRNVVSKDFTSSYPTVLLSEKFPMSAPIKISTKEFLSMSDKEKDMYCWLADIRLEGDVYSISKSDDYISYSKCTKCVNPELNNGRVNSCDKLEMTITDVDYDIIKNTYHYNNKYIKNVVLFEKRYLPKELFECILKFYNDKTTLKDVAGKEIEYLISKEMLNAIYGMCVTAILKPELGFDYENNEFLKSRNLTIDESENLIEKYNNNKNKIVFYPWGVWCTAYARKNLWNGIMNIEYNSKGESDYIYSDTDSIKITNIKQHEKYFEYYNQNITKKLEIALEHHGLNKNLLCPETIKGKKKPLGVWDDDGTYIRFKTLGAKRYMYEYRQKNSCVTKIKTTVSGIKKKTLSRYLCKKGDPFNNFNFGLEINENESDKITLNYIDDERRVELIDCDNNFWCSNILSGIYMENTTFAITDGGNLEEFIETAIGDLTDNLI